MVRCWDTFSVLLAPPGFFSSFPRPESARRSPHPSGNQIAPRNQKHEQLVKSHHGMKTLDQRGYQRAQPPSENSNPPWPSVESLNLSALSDPSVETSCQWINLKPLGLSAGAFENVPQGLIALMPSLFFSSKHLLDFVRTLLQREGILAIFFPVRRSVRE